MLTDEERAHLLDDVDVEKLDRILGIVR